MNSRDASPRGRWLKRGGSVLVAGLLGALGWVGYQQLPQSGVAAEAENNQELLVLEGEMTPDAASLESQAFAGAADDHALASPFDAPTTSRPAPRPVVIADQPSPDPAANPFAAFAPPVRQTAMTDQEPPSLGRNSLHSTTSPGMNSGVVTLASNEAAAPEVSVQLNGVAGQSEPRSPAASTPPLDPETPIASNDDPFAAFAPQPVPMETPAPDEASPHAPPQALLPPPADADWAAAEASPGVTRVQFDTEPSPFDAAPVDQPAPAQFEPEARPITTANEFAAPPEVPLQRSPQTDWSGFESQPAAVEPAPLVRSQPFAPAGSTSVEQAQTTSFDVPRPVAPTSRPLDEKLHVVQQGETYWSISRQHYGAGRYFQALAEYNKPRISDQQSLKPGMKVVVPSATTLDMQYGKLMQASGHANPPAKPRAGLRFNDRGEPHYIVGEGDTLGEIAQRYLGKTLRSDEIYRLNQEQLKNPNSLKTGMILVMPADASEVRPASAAFGGR